MGNKVSVEGEPKIKVVIVEKHPAVRRALRKRLDATSQLDVIAAFQDPAEALTFLSTEPVSSECKGSGYVILLGLQNESDEELYKTLGAVKILAKSPAAVIVLAPFADEVERMLMKQAGVSRYLLKYIDSHQLIQEIEAASFSSSTQITL